MGTLRYVPGARPPKRKYRHPELERVLEALFERHGSQLSVASLLGTNQPNVNRWANGELEPNLDYLKAIAKLAGRTADSLLLNDRQPFPALDPDAASLSVASIREIARAVVLEEVGARPATVPPVVTRSGPIEEPVPTPEELVGRKLTAAQYMAEQKAKGDRRLPWSDLLLQKVEWLVGKDKKWERVHLLHVFWGEESQHPRWIAEKAKSTARGGRNVARMAAEIDAAHAPEHADDKTVKPKSSRSTDRSHR